MKYVNKDLIRKHKKLLTILVGLCLTGIVLVLALILFSYHVVEANKKYILNPHNTAAAKDKHVRVGLVLGAGITKKGKPFKELQARLDVAAQAISKGEVQKLLLSGDNRFKYYDEPKAMKDYLVHEKHIPASKLQVDDAGRSTYESCERAARVFGQKQIIIFSAGSHLPRAIYLCRHFGIAAYGISSNVEANNSGRREMLARVKAVYNVYISGEQTLLGKPIKL